MLSALAVLVVAATPVELCRRESEALDVVGTISACGVVVDLDGVSLADRADALRAIATAHVLRNADDTAVEVFVRLLVLDSQAELTPDAGPRVQAALARAKTEVETRGAIQAEVVVDVARDSLTLRVTSDPLARVATAAVKIVTVDQQRIIPLKANAGRTEYVAEHVGIASGDARYAVVLADGIGHELDGPRLRGSVVHGVVEPSAVEAAARPNALLLTVVGVGVSLMSVGLVGGLLVAPQSAGSFLGYAMVVGVAGLVAGIGSTFLGLLFILDEQAVESRRESVRPESR